MSHMGKKGHKSAKKCHESFEWPSTANLNLKSIFIEKLKLEKSEEKETFT